MNKRRILIVSHGHPKLVAGGTETFAYDLFREFNDGERADAWFVGCVTGLHRDARPGSPLQSVEGMPREYLLHVARFDPFMLSNADDGSAIDGFARLLSSIRPDVVHYHHFQHIGIETLALVRRIVPDARIFMTLHDFHPICARDGLMLKTVGDALCTQASPDACHGCFPQISPDRFALRRTHLRNMFGFIDHFIAPSTFLRERFVAWGISGGSITRIPNGVPELAVEPEVPSDRPRNRFGYFGTVAPHKGILLAIEAAARLGKQLDFTLDIFGDARHQSPAFLAELKQFLTRARKHVRHHGAYDRNDVSHLMRSVDWIVVPSLWWENAPLVILEAFRHGRPVIAADIGGMAELIVPEINGLVFRRGDANDLARLMARAVSEPQLWQRLRNGIPAVQTLASTADAYLQLFEQMHPALQRQSA
jgi:glycosyltransferase involved in cell wall biosynthesis